MFELISFFVRMNNSRYLEMLSRLPLSIRNYQRLSYALQRRHYVTFKANRGATSAIANHQILFREHENKYRNQYNYQYGSHWNWQHRRTFIGSVVGAVARSVLKLRYIVLGGALGGGYQLNTVSIEIVK